MRFLIPIVMSPGIYRDRVGFFKPGDEIVLPDAASKPGDGVSLKFIPLDEEALEALELQAEAEVEREQERLATLTPKQKLSEAAEKAIRAKVQPIPADVLAAIKAAKGEKPAKDGGRMTAREAAAAAGVADAPSGRASDSK